MHVFQYNKKGTVLQFKKKTFYKKHTQFLTNLAEHLKVKKKTLTILIDDQLMIL